ncbi:hypothetical protein BVRB_6g156290 [Beta vulgaris subsp. vulgaris]|uniref:Uncharacterized protein n=1 Tax=Beta vulgaris subsp. vulgaris TaxID=3555 RepID=A0A0J8B7R8_BETVV|nr:hypothetical protein BVRB_6g156290 [Beta vulgaris subsp. vulgaris]
MSARARAVKAREEVLAPTSKNDREKTHMEDFTIPNFVDNDSDDNISEEEDMSFSDILFQREREDDEDRLDDSDDDTDDVEGDDIKEEDEEEQNRLQYLGERAYPLHPEIRDRTDKETYYRCLNELTIALEDLMPELEDDRRRRGVSHAYGHGDSLHAGTSYDRICLVLSRRNGRNSDSDAKNIHTF